MLGHPYRLEGVVIRGESRGKTLGFPTANLGDIPTLIPADGVYAGRVLIEESRYPAAVHIGPNPTFGTEARKVEVHVLEFDGDLLRSSARGLICWTAFAGLKFSPTPRPSKSKSKPTCKPFAG